MNKKKKEINKIREFFSDANRLKKFLEITLIIGILLITAYTRFFDLGYSDYIGDEHKAFFKIEDDKTVWEFFMSRRKGPMQFFVSHIPYLVTGDFRDELAQRIPFAVISVASVLVFYILIKRLTKNIPVALISTFLFTVNGFIVGFGRIAQYQNLNLLFSFLSLYFYTFLTEDDCRKITTSSLLGTFFWCLSFLSHWDAIFILPVVLVLFVKFLKNKKQDKKFKMILIAKNILLGSLILLPFLVPFIFNQLTNQENSEYFQRRIEMWNFNGLLYKQLIELYNPLITFWLLLTFGLLGMFLYKKSYIFSIWFFYGYLLFEIFARKPGTHIYNFVIPLIVLCAMSIQTIYQVVPKLLKVLWGGLVVLIFTFLLYQTWFIFIDHKVEYPWGQKVLFDFKDLEDKYYDWQKTDPKYRTYHKIITPKYTLSDKLPLFGFPHRRYWDQINEFVAEQSLGHGQPYKYITNEDKTISEWYMTAGHGADRPFYVVGVKKPLSFVEDYKFPQVGNKRRVYEINNEFGNSVVVIFLAE